MSVRGADLQQAMPVAAIAGQARDLQSQHDAGASQAHLGDQSLEAFAIGGRGSRLAQVAVDDDDPFDRPTQGHGPFAQGVLPLGALGVLEHLPQRRLADIQIGIPLEMAGVHLRVVRCIMTGTSGREWRIMLAKIWASCDCCGTVNARSVVASESSTDRGSSEAADGVAACGQASHPGQQTLAESPGPVPNAASESTSPTATPACEDPRIGPSRVRPSEHSADRHSRSPFFSPAFERPFDAAGMDDSRPNVRRTSRAKAVPGQDGSRRGVARRGSPGLGSLSLCALSWSGSATDQAWQSAALISGLGFGKTRTANNPKAADAAVTECPSSRTRRSISYLTWTRSWRSKNSWP